jgi:transcription elongation GreA/GreB family factor
MSKNRQKRVSEHCWVEVRGFEPGGEVEKYHIVDPAEADATEFRIASTCPLAQTLIGASIGQSVEFESPNCPVKLTVVDCGERSV